MSRLQGTRRGPVTRPFVDRHLHRRVDGEGGARRHRAGESAEDQELEVVDRPHRLQRHRLLEPEGGGGRPEVVVRGVEVAVHHAGHDRPPIQIDDPVVRPGCRPPGRVPTAPDPVTVHHHVGIGEGGVLAVHQGGVAQDQTGRPGHGWTTTLMDPVLRSPATRKASAASSRSKRWVMTAPGRSGVAASIRAASSNSEVPWWWP